MQEGWIKLYRSSFENRLYFDEPFTRFQAWIDLLLLANHKDGSFFKRGNIVKVPRGTVARSMKELADRWQWSEAKVSRFIQFLESEYIRQVKAQKSNVTTLITILNYDRYQTNEGAELRTNVRTNDAQTTTYKNVKNKKEENNNINNSAGVFTPGPPLDVILPDKTFEANDFQELPRQNVESIKSFLSISKQILIDEDQIQGLWGVFKIQELTGVKLYRNKEDVYRHFLNWAKKQSFAKTGRSKSSSKKTESNLRPFSGEIRGLKFSEDFTLCEMEDGSIVNLDRNKRDMAESGMISPREIVKTYKK
jgi:hypothetical protein